MARRESSFADHDTNIIYPEIFNVVRTSGNIITLKPLGLASYTSTDFYYDVATICQLQGSTGANSAAAYANAANALNTYKTAQPELDIKVLDTELIQFAASSFSYIFIVSIFRI